MVDYSDEKLLKSLKKTYDGLLKTAYLNWGNGHLDTEFPYSSRYPLYFKKSVLDDLIASMGKDIFESYKNANGNELTEGKNGTPPKMLSIGSSSRFCYCGLSVNVPIGENEGALFFLRPDDRVKTFSFEKPLPVFGGGKDDRYPPTMDAYVSGGKRDYFFECKRHEMFDYHKNPFPLSARYFHTGKDLIVEHIPQRFLERKGGRLFIDASAFGLGFSPFDIKQFLTHLMGIKINKGKEACDFIYFYSLLDKEFVADDAVLSVLAQVQKDAVKVFETNFVKEYCEKNGITIRLYIDERPFFVSACKDGVKRIY